MKAGMSFKIAVNV